MLTHTERPVITLVVGCFLRRKCDGRFLIARRSLSDSNPGLWEGPGGKVEKGQTIHQALADEIQQETGLLVEFVSDFPFVDSRNPSEGTMYVGLYYLVHTSGKNPRLSHEHCDYAWVTYKEMLAYDLTPYYKAAAAAYEPILNKK